MQIPDALQLKTFFSNTKLKNFRGGHQVHRISLKFQRHIQKQSTELRKLIKVREREMSTKAENYAQHCTKESNRHIIKADTPNDSSRWNYVVHI